MPLVSSLLLFLMLARLSSSLIIHMQPFSSNDTSITLSSHYSTLGWRANTSINSPFFLLSNNDIDNTDCSISENVSGLVVVLAERDLPSLMGCTRSIMGRTIALVRILQHKGARAAILPAIEKVNRWFRTHSIYFWVLLNFQLVVYILTEVFQYLNGRVIGFAYTTIPVVVVQDNVLAFITTNAESISTIEFEPLNNYGV
jgi:hypothetical protein